MYDDHARNFKPVWHHLWGGKSGSQKPVGQSLNTAIYATTWALLANSKLPEHKRPRARHGPIQSPAPFPTVIRRYHKQRPERWLVSRFKAEGPSLDSASAVLFFKKVVVCGHSLVVTLPLTINDTLKWLSSLPILMQVSFWWWQCSDRYRYSPSVFLHLHAPPPPSTHP